MKISPAMQSQLLTYAAIGVGGIVVYYFLKNRIGAVVDSVNPVNPKNIFNQALVGAVGQEKVTSVFDKIFAAVDLVNPFNESDAYAKTVFTTPDINKAMTDIKKEDAPSVKKPNFKYSDVDPFTKDALNKTLPLLYPKY